MARFRFPFENVIRYRKSLEEIARKDLQEVLADYHSLLKELKHLQDQQHEAFLERHRMEIQGGRSIGHLTQVHEFLQGQDIRIERVKKEITEVEKRVEELREILRARVIDTKIIKELKNRKKLEFDKKVRAKERAEADDISLMRHRFKQDVK